MAIQAAHVVIQDQYYAHIMPRTSQLKVGQTPGCPKLLV